MLIFMTNIEVHERFIIIIFFTYANNVVSLIIFYRWYELIKNQLQTQNQSNHKRTNLAQLQHIKQRTRSTAQEVNAPRASKSKNP